MVESRSACSGVHSNLNFFDPPLPNFPRFPPLEIVQERRGGALYFPKCSMPSPTFPLSARVGKLEVGGHFWKLPPLPFARSEQPADFCFRVIISPPSRSPFRSLVQGVRNRICLSPKLTPHAVPCAHFLSQCTRFPFSFPLRKREGVKDIHVPPPSRFLTIPTSPSPESSFL